MIILPWGGGGGGGGGRHLVAICLDKSVKSVDSNVVPNTPEARNHLDAVPVWSISARLAQYSIVE